MWKGRKRQISHRNTGDFYKKVKQWRQRGIYTPEYGTRAGKKRNQATYTTDTRPTESIKQNAKHSDLFICEGMYGEKDKQKKAKEYKHMTFYEAAQLAKKKQK